VLWPGAPGWNAVAAIAAERGSALLPAAPPALDLARRGAARDLGQWLRRRTTSGDGIPGKEWHRQHPESQSRKGYPCA